MDGPTSIQQANGIILDWDKEAKVWVSHDEGFVIFSQGRTAEEAEKAWVATAVAGIKAFRDLWKDK